MRASRLLTIQLLLETRGRMSAQALANALEISVRTLYRDVEQLAAAGVPIYAERGRSGGFQLLDGWKSSLTGFTAGEAQAIFMSGLAGPAAELGLGHQITDAQLKLLAALPINQRHEAQHIQARFHFDPVAWYRTGDTLPNLLTVATAAWHDQQLTMRYESWNGISEQTVHPLGVVLKAGTWYLVAALEGKPRTYRVSNIHSCNLLEAHAQRPAGFDLASYWAEAVKRFEHDRYQGVATVLASPQGLHALQQLSAAVAQAVDTALPTSADQPHQRRFTVTIPIESLSYTATQLLPLAPEVEVIAPLALRHALLEKLEQITTCYGVSLPKPDTPCQD